MLHLDRLKRQESRAIVEDGLRLLGGYDYFSELSHLLLLDLADEIAGADEETQRKRINEVNAVRQFLAAMQSESKLLSETETDSED